jgi:hypothetical protein
MMHMNERITRSLLISAMIALLSVIGYVGSQAEKTDVSKAVFYVG